MAPSTKQHPKKKFTPTEEQKEEMASRAIFDAIIADYESGKREIHAGA